METFKLIKLFQNTHDKSPSMKRYKNLKIGKKNIDFHRVSHCSPHCLIVPAKCVYNETVE